MTFSLGSTPRSLVKYNDKSIAAITEIGAGAKDSMVLIKTFTASGDDTIDFIDGTDDVVLDNTYPIYLIKVINSHPSNNDTGFTFQFNAAGGSGFNETITSVTYDTYHAEDGTAAAVRYADSDQAQGTAYQNLCTGDSGNDECCSGELYLFNPSSTTFVKHFKTRFNDTHSGYTTEKFCAGYVNTTSAIDEVSFKYAAGTIDLGTFKLYGIKDS